MQPNSLLTDTSIDALVKIRELAAPDPVRDRDVIETALLRYVAFIMAERELHKMADELHVLTAEYDAQRKALFDE